MNEIKTQNSLRFLDGGGEMGALIRSIDWSKGLLGKPETWPQSLRTTLSIILNSRFPMFCFGGLILFVFITMVTAPV